MVSSEISIWIINQHFFFLFASYSLLIKLHFAPIPLAIGLLFLAENHSIPPSAGFIAESYVAVFRQNMGGLGSGRI